MKITFVVHNPQVDGYNPHVTIANGDMNEDFSTHTFVCNLSEYLRQFQESYGYLPAEFLGCIKSKNTPDWYSGTAFKFLKDTVEGQHMLEWVLSQYGIRHPLKLDAADMYADKGIEIADKDKWDSISVPDVNPTARFLEEIDEPCDTYVYTLRLVNHDTDTEMYYVGKSTQIMCRLKSHISSGGDFGAVRGKNTYVHEIVSIEPESHITEKNKYKQVSKNVTEDVFGGK